MRRATPSVILTLLVFGMGCEGELIDRGHIVPPNEPPATPPALALRLGDAGADDIVDMAVDPAGNIYLTGSFSGSVDFDPGPGTAPLISLGSEDVFLAKYSPSGALLWADRIGSDDAERVTSLVSDAGGNLFIGGAFQGAADFDPGAGTQFLTSTGGEDGFVAAYTSSGTLTWARRVGGLGADAVLGVAVDAAGRVFATGTFSGAANTLPAPGPTLTGIGSEPDGFLIGIAASGAIEFGVRFGGAESDLADAVAVTTDGTIIVGGAFRGTATFGTGATPTSLTATGGDDAFLAGFNAIGELLWARALSGTGEQQVRAGGLAADLDGGVVATGSFTGTTDFEPGAGTTTRTSLGGTDWFAARYDALGNLQSVFSVGSSASEGAPRPAVDAEGAVLLTGAFAGALDFDPGPGTRIIASLASAGASDIYAARYSMAGALSWVSRFGEGTSVADRVNTGTAIAQAPLGGVLVAGRFFGSPDFDPGSPVYRLTSLGGDDGVVVLLTSTGALALTP